jgi:hypothetical protein
MSFPLGGRLRNLLKDVPVLHDLSVVVQAEDVHASHVPRLVVRVDGDEVSLGDHPMNLDVERADRAEEVLGRLPPFPACGLCWT